MDPRNGNLWVIATCVGIVMISCYISGVACDVPDDVVYTDEHKTVRIGDSVVLKCQFRGTPSAVYWKKGDDPERSPTLVSWIIGDPVTGSCVGERLCRIMEMNAEFSLIIKEVSIAEQGLYLCRVSNYKGNQIHNFTDISVFSPPKEPYPIINECQMISPTDTETTCTIPTNQSVEISCSASGYYPDIDLYFLHGTTRLHTKDTIEVINLDGTKNKTIYANATASEISYICFAPIPGSLEQKTTAVLVTGPTISIDRRDGSVAKVVVPVIFSILLAVICIPIILWHRRRRQRGQDKSVLTDEDLKKFALSITKRHCQKLGKPFKLSAGAIANRNAEDLEMFRTDIMLKAWVRNQKCSNYDIRRRLRQAAEQCTRQDIADIFIRKEQSEVMSSTVQLTITNEEQNSGASRSENDIFIRKEQSEVMTSTVQLMITNEEQNSGVSRSENVTSISRDELDRIGCYAGSAVLLAFCKKYDVTVPGQQSPDGKELLCDIINVLKPKLDSELERIKKEKKSSTPRKTLRQLLKNEYPRYACLLAMKKPFNIFDVELIDLAFRLIMADVYPFAKALNISDTVLNSYRRIIRPSYLTQGTANILKQYTHDRTRMVKALKQAGYSEEARALYFGFEISLGDVIEVEKRVDMAQLAKQLGISDDVQSTEPDNQVKPVLLKWRDTVHSSTFNHRLVLADALFTMGEEQLALDIISGVHRNRVINEPMLELLAATVPEGQVPTYEVMDQKTKNEKGLVKWSAKSPTESSNKLLGAGCYAFAYENMAVFHHGTDTGNVASEELRQGGSAINKPGKKGDKKKKEGMEKSTNGDTLIGNTRKEGTRKGLEQVAKDNHTIPTEGMQETNTTEEGKGGSQKNEDKNSLVKEVTDTNNVIAEISREEKNPSLTNEEEVMQEKSRDGAAKSKENTTENIDTKKQGNTPDGSDECQQDESSKLLTQAGT